MSDRRGHMPGCGCRDMPQCVSNGSGGRDPDPVAFIKDFVRLHFGGKQPSAESAAAAHDLMLAARLNGLSPSWCPLECRNPHTVLSCVLDGKCFVECLGSTDVARPDGRRTTIYSEPAHDSDEMAEPRVRDPIQT